MTQEYYAPEFIYYYLFYFFYSIMGQKEKEKQFMN